MTFQQLFGASDKRSENISILESPFKLFDQLTPSNKEGLTTSTDEKCKAKSSVTKKPEPIRQNTTPVIIACTIPCIAVMYFLWYVFIIKDDITKYPKVAISVGVIFMLVSMQVCIINMIDANEQYVSNERYINTLICTCAIMIPTFIMINSIQSLSGIYENTIAVWILQSIYSLETIFGDLINKNAGTNSNGEPPSTNVNMNNKKTLFDASFKLLTWEHIIKDTKNMNIGKVLNHYIEGGFFTNTDTITDTINNRTVNKERLKEANVEILRDTFENIKCLILKKNLIGNFIWMTSASVISILMCAYST